MKRYILIISMLLLTFAVSAQIKFSENLNTEVRSMNRNDLISKKLVPLNDINLSEQNQSFGTLEDPIGCKVYILSDTARLDVTMELLVATHPCKSLNEKKVTFKPLSPGEYTISNVIRFSEQLKRWLESEDSEVDDYQRLGAWLSRFIKDLALPSTQDFLTGNYDNSSWNQIYVLTDSAGNEYYLVKSGRSEKGERHVCSGLDYQYKYGNWTTARFDAYRLILIPFYEEACKLVGHRCAIIGDLIGEESTYIDATGNLFQLKGRGDNWYKWHSYSTDYGEGNGSAYISNRDKYAFYTCKDVVIYKEKVTAVFESSNGDTFALPLSGHLEGNKYINLYNTSCNDRDFAIVPEKNFIEEEKRHKLAQEIEEYDRLKREKAKKEEEERRRKELIAKYGEVDGNHVADHKVAIGMTKEMCEDAWGKRHETYTTIRAGVTTDLWVYDYKTNLYFVNGKLTQIEK